MFVPQGDHVQLWGIKEWIKSHLDKAAQETLQAKNVGIEQKSEREGEEGRLEEGLKKHLHYSVLWVLTRPEIL